MNQLSGVIKSIITEEHISLVVVESAGFDWYGLVIDTPETASYLLEGKEIEIVFKESAVSIAKNITGLISIRNRIPCRITDIKIGAVLSTISLFFNGIFLSSVITTNAVKQLDLQIDDKVKALIKTTDISLMQVED